MQRHVAPLTVTKVYQTELYSFFANIRYFYKTL